MLPKQSMKRLIIVFYKIFLKIFRNFSWYFDLCYYKFTSKSHNLLKLPQGKKIILIPHSDDEWIGNSMLIRNEKELELVNLDMPGDDSMDLHLARRLEMSAIASLYNHRIYDLKKDKVSSLVSILNRNPISQVFVPFFFDWHEEHIEVMCILKDALESANDILDIQIAMYPVSCPLPLELMNYGENMSREDWVKKWTLFKKYYPSQITIPYKRFAINDKISGSSVGCFAIEPYCVVTAREWLDMYTNYLLSESEKSKLKQNLNNIKKTRNLINKFYTIR